MEIGIQVVGGYDHVRLIGQMCENAGIAAVALADHYLYGSDESAWSQPAYDSLVQAAALARDTSSVEIVMLVSPITFRHPAVYAKTVTTIDEISDGRFVFGIGTGWHEGEHDVFGFEFGTLSERFEWLEDALGYLRVFLDDPTQGYSGRFWSLKGLDINPRARTDLRLMVGGGGAVKTPTLVGRFADEYNLYRHEEADVSARLDVMRSAAVEAGRDPDAIFLSTSYPVIGGDDDAEFDAFFGDVASRQGMTVEQVKDRLSRVPRRSWDEHAEELQRLATLGFDRTYLQVVANVPWAAERALERLA